MKLGALHSLATLYSTFVFCWSQQSMALTRMCVNINHTNVVRRALMCCARCTGECPLDPGGYFVVKACPNRAISA